METSPLKTLFYKHHLAHKALMMPFAGWQLPSHYTCNTYGKSGAVAEHEYTRNACGVFDVSHMGEIEVSGSGAQSFLQVLLPSDISKLADGMGRYSCFLRYDGGIVDDVIVYRLGKERYFLCVNAARRKRVYEWVKEFCNHPPEEFAYALKGSCEVKDLSQNYIQLAIQGPQSRDALACVFAGEDLQKALSMPYGAMIQSSLFSYQTPTLLARTGYTGELGYELYAPATQEIADHLWQALFQDSANGSPLPRPIGLSARNSLRLESCFLLYGADMDETSNPYEVGLGWLVSPDRHFVGSKALQAYKQDSPKLEKTSVAFVVESPGMAREGMDIWNSAGSHQEGVMLGKVTSGGYLPTLKTSGGLASINHLDVSCGNIWIDQRRNRPWLKARIVKKPFYASRAKG